MLDPYKLHKFTYLYVIHPYIIHHKKIGVVKRLAEKTKNISVFYGAGGIRSKNWRDFLKVCLS